MTITAQNARARRALQPRGFSKQKIVFDIASFFYCILLGRFQTIQTDVLLIFSFITGDKTEFLSQMMFSNEYITGI